MSKAETPHRWFPVWRATPPAADLDPADYGTAFGLDMSLSAIDHEAPVSEPSAPSPLVGRRPGWVRRLAARRKPLA